MYLKDLDLLQSVLLGGFFGHETESAIVVVLFNSALLSQAAITDSE